MSSSTSDIELSIFFVKQKNTVPNYMFVRMHTFDNVHFSHNIESLLQNVFSYYLSDREMSIQR